MEKPAKKKLNVFYPTILVDTQEQIPYRFLGIPADEKEGGGEMQISSLIKKIPTGDYSLAGHERDGITIERKTKSDLYRTLSPGGKKTRNRNRNRFKRELLRMQSFQHSYVIVECELSELLSDPPRYSNYKPKSLHRTIISMELTFPKTHWRFCPNRDFAENLTFRILHKYWQRFLAKRP